MQVDVLFPNVKVYNIDCLDVIKDQTFQLLTDDDGSSDWFSNNDNVLDISVDGKNATVKAANTGRSTIQMQDSTGEILKRISITVKESLEEAKSLGLTVGEPENK